ncbi:MAG: hypothetical protein RL143_1045, partial [Pseudomonadota bacterium]
MLVMRGAPALSAFRHDKLLSSITARVPAVTDIYAEFVHFADLSTELNAEQVAVLERILRYGPKADVQTPASQPMLVVPRPGTISPWSSKATDIVHNCGLSEISRIERGVAYYLTTSAALSANELALVEAEIHDRMVESVLSNIEEAESLFSHEQPREMGRVDTL